MNSGVKRVVIVPTGAEDTVRVIFGEGFAAPDVLSSFKLTRTNCRLASGVEVRRRLPESSDKMVQVVLGLDGLAFLQLEPNGFCLCARRAANLLDIVSGLLTKMREEAAFCQCEVIAEGNDARLQRVISAAAPVSSKRGWFRSARSR